METANCQAGGISDPMRRNMMMGVQGGKKDAATEPTEFESLMINMIMAKLIQMGTAASGVCKPRAWDIPVSHRCLERPGLVEWTGDYGSLYR